MVHGDYRIDNMIFAPDTPQVRAVLDWELSTLGHPLADLAYQCMHWRLPHEGHFRGLGGVDRGALDAAIELSIPHGGKCPRGRLAEDGVIPLHYQLEELESRKYSKRTEQNVVDADGTLILFYGQLSGGTEFTRTRTEVRIAIRPMLTRARRNSTPFSACWAKPT